MLSARLNLLLVDDDVVDREAVRRALSTAGVITNVVEASDAGEARRAMESQSFDCLLLDYQLPGVDGLSLLRELRAGGVSTPVVVLTGRGDEATAVEIMRSGASDYINKATLSPARLSESLHRVLHVRRAELETERTRRALEESERQYRFLADFVPQIVWTTRPDGAVDYFNARMQEYTGLDAAALLGNGWTQVVHPEDMATAHAGWAASHRNGQSLESEVRLRRADGEYRWHLTRAVPQRDAAGNVIRWFGTSTDIHEQKQYAAALQRERERVEEANRAKDVFLATVSHELRTPLTAMLGWLQMLRTGALAAEKRERALETVERNARAQAQLVEDLLDVSRIVSGKLRIEIASVAIGDLVRSTVEVLRPTADARRVSLVCRVEPGTATVRGDAGRLGQVVSNLLSNAIKFTPSNGTVSVEMTVAAPFVEIVVQDSGQGIPQEFLPHVFEPFRQAESSERKSAGGLGLGLAIVRHIVDLHGGTVSAHSDGEGTGARFVVKLPIARARGGRRRTSETVPTPAATGSESPDRPSRSRAARA